MLRFREVPLPSGIAPDSEKQKPEFGEKVCQAIIGATSEGRQHRNKIIANNRLFVKGKQPIQPYLDQMTHDGKMSFANILYSPRPIVSKFQEIVVNGYMEQLEYPKVTAMAKHVQDRKVRKRDEAKYRMQYEDVIKQVSEAAGIPMEDPNAFVPKTEEELDVWYQLNEQEREEKLMQRMLTFIAEDVDLEYLKERVLIEQFQAGLHGVYNYLDRNNRLKVDFIPAEDCLFDAFSGAKSDNLGYAGRLLRLQVSDIRARWSLTKDQERMLYNAAYASQGKLGNVGSLGNWDNRWATSTVGRPYDNWTVEVAHIWWKCNRVVNYVEGFDRYGRPVFNTFNSEEEIRPSARKTPGKVYPQTSYEGYFLLSGESVACIEWAESRNILREGEDKDQVLCPFIFRMPGNTGDMIPNAPVTKIIPDVMSIDLLDMKIKLAVARSAPSGYTVDVDSLMNIDLGEGLGVVQPLTIMDIQRNTGWTFYRSRSEDGSTQYAPPIVPNQVGMDPQISSFLELYNWHRNEIREILGINEFRDGSATNPRIGYRYAQAQLSQSNTATLSLYRAWLTTGSELFRHIGIRVWDSLVFGTPNKGYLKFLGEKDAEFVKSAKEITASSYDIKYEMGMTIQDLDRLNAMIQTALAAGTIDVVDAIAIEAVDDIQLAYQILRVRTEMRRRQRMEDAEQNARMSAEANAQAGVMTEEAKAQSSMAIAQTQAEVKRVEGESDRDREMEKLVWDLIRGEAEGRPIPPQYQALVDMVLDNRGLNQAQEFEQKVQQQQMMEMQEQQVVEEVAQEQMV